MKSDLADIYRLTFRFALAWPVLFLLPALPELFQHLVEYRLGMYESREAFRAAALSADRLGAGYLKTVALILPGYWMVRYVFGRDARPEARALTLWLPVFALSAGVQALGLFGPSAGTLLGLEGRSALAANGVARAALTVLTIYLTAWVVAAPLGNPAVGPAASLRIMTGSFWRTVAYSLTAALPVTALHYLLGYGAIGRPGAVAAVLLFLDGLAVALLAHAAACASALAARAAAERQGASLLPAGAAAA